MSTQHRTRLPEGVEEYHRKACRSRDGGRCNCAPSYRAKATPERGRRIVSPRFPTARAAKNWMTDTLSQIHRGTYVEPTRVTVAQVAKEFIDGARAGDVLNRNGERYKPSVIR